MKVLMISFQQCRIFLLNSPMFTAKHDLVFSKTLKFLLLTQFCTKIVELGTPERVWLLNIGFPELITSTNIVVAPEKA